MNFMSPIVGVILLLAMEITAGIAMITMPEGIDLDFKKGSSSVIDKSIEKCETRYSNCYFDNTTSRTCGLLRPHVTICVATNL